MNKELITIFKDIEFKYIFKKRKYDNNSMIVVFSGFGGTGNFTYDFKNVLNEIHSNVLWIKDDFFGDAAYYHSVNGKEIHSIVNNFILDIAQKNKENYHTKWIKITENMSVQVEPALDELEQELRALLGDNPTAIS